MTVFAYHDYKVYLQAWVAAQPKKGRGIQRRMAEMLGTSSTMLSHVLNGTKDLSLEMADGLADFMALESEEADYFLLLVQFAKAGSHSLKRRLEKQIAKEQKRVGDLAHRVKADAVLPDVVKAKFYSHWAYSGVRNLTACAPTQDVDALSAHLKLPRPMVQKIVDFLIENRLCVIEDGRLAPGPQQTHVGAQSELALHHHQNWRLHGLTKIAPPNEQNLFFTAPMSLSKDAAHQIRQLLPKVIEDVRDLVRPSTSEVVRCLNIDWFEY